MTTENAKMFEDDRDRHAWRVYMAAALSNVVGDSPAVVAVAEAARCADLALEEERRRHQ